MHIPKTANNDDPSAEFNPLATILPASLSKPTRRMGEINQYMAMYYETRMKEEAERRISTAQLKYSQATEEERLEEGMKKPEAVVIRKETAVKFWSTESQETKDEVRAIVEAQHQQELRSWKAKQETPKTAQQYHQ
jgi:hypothetical protein